MADNWTLWFMPLGEIVPYERTFVRLEYAIEAAWQMSELIPTRIHWLKVFRSGDENDVRARWNPEEGWTCLSRTAAETLGVLTP